MHRDPDGDTEIALFADGLPCDHAVEYHVDPGRGTADEANELRSTRYQYLTEASPAVRERLVELYARYPINSED